MKLATLNFLIQASKSMKKAVI